MRSKEPLVLLGVLLVCLIISGINPWDRLTWWLEVAPILIGVPILILTYHRFTFSPLVYRLILLHALVLMIGGHWSYARVPFGFWLERVLHLARNDYDRIGHFMQGFVPALIAREVLLRRTPLRRGLWLFFLVTCVCLALSACYEFVEWWTALAGGSAADAFLGTQGDVWDTQKDMLMALIGALLAQLTLARAHDRSMARATHR
jgi:putative membrane protein